MVVVAGGPSAHHLGFLALLDPAAGAKMHMAKAYVVCIVSMLAGAAVVHNIYKPDLVIVMSPCNDPHSKPRAL